MLSSVDTLVVLTFESVDEMQNCSQFPSESFPVVLFTILCCGSGGVCYDNIVLWWFKTVFILNMDPLL